MSPQSPPPPPPPRDSGRGPGGRPPLQPSWPRWSLWVVGGLVLAALFLSSIYPGSQAEKVSYSEFLDQVANDQVERIEWNNNNGSIEGELKSGDKFETNGPLEPSEEDRL